MEQINDVILPFLLPGNFKKTINIILRNDVYKYDYTITCSKSKAITYYFTNYWNHAVKEIYICSDYTLVITIIFT
jgi:hypothetical protein